MEKCICILEPNGDHGLEGYNLNWEYRYEHLEKDKNGNPYYRVYIDEEDSYDTCGVNTFHKYFKPQSKEQLSLETYMVKYILIQDPLMMGIYDIIKKGKVNYTLEDNYLTVDLTNAISDFLRSQKLSANWHYAGAGNIGIRL